MGWWNSLRRWFEETLLPGLDNLLPAGTFLGNAAGRWLGAAVVFLLSLFVLRLVKGILARRVRRLAERTETDWYDGLHELIEATRRWFLPVLAVYVGSLMLVLPEKPGGIVRTVTVLFALLQGALWGNVLIAFAIRRYVERRMEQDAAAVTTISALGFLGKLALWSVVALLMLDNLGMDVTALVAGLGVGGIAVALAAQNILGDLFASMSIVLDKPFVLGDFIIVGDQMGTVEHIGLKTTRLRSISGEQLVFSNTDLLASRIRNFKRMYERRIAFSVGVTYGTPKDKLEAIPGVLRAAVEANEQVRFDRAHFKSLGDSALVFEVVYYVLVPDYAVSMDIQQAINLALVDRFAAMGVEFAYPTQTIHVQQD